MNLTAFYSLVWKCPLVDRSRVVSIITTIGNKSGLGVNRPSTWGYSLGKPAKMAFSDTTSLSLDFSASLEMSHDTIITRKIPLFQVHVIMLSNFWTSKEITWNLRKYLVLQLICNFTLTKSHGIPLQPFSVSSHRMLYPEFSGIVHFFPSANQEFHIWIWARGNDTNEHPL